MKLSIGAEAGRGGRGAGGGGGRGAGGGGRRGAGGRVAMEETSGRRGSYLRRFRSSTLILVPVYTLMVVIGAISLHLLGGRRRHAESSCYPHLRVGIWTVIGSSGLRLLWMVGIGVSQAQAAETLLKNLKGTAAVDLGGGGREGEGGEEGPEIASSDKKANRTRQERRIMYKRWLAWSQGSVALSAVQVIFAVFLAYCLAVVVSRGQLKVGGCCPSERGDQGLVWLKLLLPILAVTSGAVSLLQCCIGADVLAWRSLYAMHDFAWRAHYQEMFDRTIREVLCCLGRSRYWENDEDDDVKTVASLLGELVTYRAFGASHLELLAGLAMLTRQTWLNSPTIEELERPATWKLREAAVLHPYAIAAYTGPLLDIGRNPLTWACVWLYRQGVLSCCWGRKGWPLIEGDNYWRGHSAAFLRFSQLPPSCLLKGRVKQQANNESVYFVIALADVRMVVVCVRGTETPEDLITDGLGRECILTETDLGGALSHLRLPGQGGSSHRFGHEGVVKTARELAYQLDSLCSAGSSAETGDVQGQDSFIGINGGFLSTILGPGGMCEGYQLRFVGHSLGGAVATVTAMILQPRFPNVHVYAYGVLPCLDLETAEACRGFVTSIVYNDEFSCRLSLASIMRLRTAALRAVAPDPSSSSALVSIPAYLMGGPAKVSKKIKRVVYEEGESVEVPTSAAANALNLHMAAHGESEALPMEVSSFVGRHRRRRRIYQVKGNNIWSMEDAHNTQEMEGLVREDEDSDGDGTTTCTPSVGEPAAVVGLSFQGTSLSTASRKTSLKEASSQLVTVSALPHAPLQLTEDLSAPPSDRSDWNELRSGYDAARAADNPHADAGNGVGSCQEYSEEEGEVGADAIRPFPEGSAWGDNNKEVAGTSGQECREDNDGRRRGGEAWSYWNGVVVTATASAQGSQACENVESVWPVELFLPGQVIHLIRIHGGGQWPPSRPKHRAVVVDRRRLAEVRVSPSMFLDHLPWRYECPSFHAASLPGHLPVSHL
ncbi:hypothetical protein CBR_g2768 [Chara braunii]|uniref:Uncharacterized protein n=1 Tax=Chara braunii TaxID=69332 RepID=A0A388KDS9_CHABU|nr:hypothetical protein CBR_g2768 [Chara braunii]|eukprot:GBG68218.1 hypothetical protein CBR_g2768 [Chara braunii]